MSPGEALEAVTALKGSRADDILFTLDVMMDRFFEDEELEELKEAIKNGTFTLREYANLFAVLMVRIAIDG